MAKPAAMNPQDGPPGARPILTAQLQMAQHVINDTANYRSVGVIHGPAGLGKTYAMRVATKRLDVEGSKKAMPVCRISFPSGPTMRLVAELLLHALTGNAPTTSTNRFWITGELVRELTRLTRLVVVDEAQRLSGDCIELLRYLHDHDDTSFGLLYVGGDGCWEVLSREPMLRSRVWRRLTFTSLSRNEVPQVMRGYHPIYAGVDDDLLHYVDDRFARGIWRNWALFSATAELLARRAGRTKLDEELVANVFALHGGGIDGPPAR
ncbi:ATP-binding protein [Micromonospora musae]|uniref:ATP-binding protein n=1 Tax=Micromonospora musae TaxID=1894970 RepID=UPI0034011D28